MERRKLSSSRIRRQGAVLHLKLQAAQAKPGSSAPNSQCVADSNVTLEKQQLSNVSKEGRKDSTLKGVSSSPKKALGLSKEETASLVISNGKPLKPQAKPALSAPNSQCIGDSHVALEKQQPSNVSKEGRRDSNLEGASSNPKKALDLSEEETGVLEREKKKFARFLRVFPPNKEKIETYIKCLREIADEIDKMHKDCTIARITGNSINILGECSTIASHLLVSFSALWSLRMDIAASGAELVGTATGVAANITDNVYQFMKRTEGEKLMEKVKASLEELDLDLDLDLELPPIAPNFFDNSQEISDIMKSALALNKFVDALACVKADPKLKNLALKIAAKGEETEDLKKVKEALPGISIVMSKAERQKKCLLSIAILMKRIDTLVQDTLSLLNDTKVPETSVMRQKARKLEQTLEDLEKIYESLRKENIIEEQF